MISLKNARMLMAAILLLSSVQFASATIDDSVVSEIADDYYDVYGSPHLVANLACDDTFDRGDDAILYVNLMNDGQLTGYEANDDNIDDDLDEYGETMTRSFMSSELASDRAITTADSITATLSLVDTDAPIDIQLDTELLGSISSGRSLSSPAEFPIEIYDDAEAGTYRLKLFVTYRYQRDSAVTPPYGDVYYWYEDMNQTMYIDVVVEDEPYFKVIKTESDIQQGDKETVNITYANTGDNVAYDCIARISVVDPFTTTDDEAYLGDMYPGDSKTATFEVNVADDATVKSYAINTEVKYTDEHDDSQYSDDLKAPVDVGSSQSGLDGNIMIGAVVLVGIIGTPLYMRSRNKRKEE
ncbi:COG1361 S-layer family protein [Methanolobus vulcani]|uniref:Uncharacterized protein n=1 Tax=Methanolobus vulcani TaxID=38026 RepID=A0A7Z8KMT0_9EURY|nr:hypothetical protein [Methanolobus vulcani]TQD24996.1 hypothetical protein FKV42_07995 [Methanolobus vulcani]